MAKLPDYYEILQVHPKASREVIDAAYRKLASQYHPDVNDSPRSAEKMKLLNEAYEVLSDPARRASYDNIRYESPLDATPVTWSWKRIVFPIGVILIVLVAVRFGFRLALMMLALLIVVWLWGRLSK